MSSKKTIDLLACADAVPVGCRISRGKLIPSFRPVGLDGNLPDGIVFACYSDTVSRFFICTKDYVYVSGNGKSFVSLYPLKGGRSFLVEDVYQGTARAVIVNGASAVAHTGSSYSGFSYGADLRCGVMHCGRIFGGDTSDGLLLRWSGEGGIRDWKEGIYGSGSVKLDPARGEILNILEYGEKLVVVRKYGLTVVSAYGLPENYAVEITDTDTDEIFADTACSAGGKLLFYTASGLCAFDGSAVKHITHRLANEVSSPVYAVSVGTNYYLICDSKSLASRAIMCFDTEDGESFLIDAAANSICSADNLYIYNNEGVYRLENGADYTFTCNGVNFGTGGKKTVTAVDIGGEADVYIGNGRTARYFSCAGGVIRPRIRGKNFNMIISGGKTLDKLTATAEVCGEI